MNQHASFKSYLIKLFLFTLIMLGIAETLINFAYLRFIYPVLDQVFLLHKIFDKTSLSGLLALSVENLFWIIIWQFFSILPLHLSETFQRYMINRIDNGIFTRFLSSQTDCTSTEATLYIVLFITVLLILVLVWVLPFVLAAFFFSYQVSKKVHEMEKITLEEQQKYEKQKSLLLSDIAHDLKTPITTISGYAEVLLSDEITVENTRDYLQAIYHKSLHMNNIISLLFEYVTLDSAGFSLHLKSENFSELVRGCVATVYTDFEDKNMNLEIDIPDEDYFAHIDMLHMQRAIHNVLVNAVKHNPGGTTVTVRLRQKNNFLVLQVLDNGVKIPEDTIAHIFDPFVQGDQSRSRKSGSGLGLSISKKVLNMHKGDLIVHQTNDPQKSYTKLFIFTLPHIDQ